MPQDVLDMPDGTPIEKKRGGDRVSEYMRRHFFLNSCHFAKFTEPGYRIRKCEGPTFTHYKKPLTVICATRYKLPHPVERSLVEENHALFFPLSDNCRLPCPEIDRGALEGKC